MTDSALLAKVSWRLLPFLGLLYFVSFLDRVNVGYAALTMNAEMVLAVGMALAGVLAVGSRPLAKRASTPAGS